MDKIIAQLFAARDIAHSLHLRTRSFARHIALNELYDALLPLTDSLAEMFQGKYGVSNFDARNAEVKFDDADPLTFIKQLAEWAEASKQTIPQDSFIQSEWDIVLAAVYKAKYKLENLA